MSWTALVQRELKEHLRPAGKWSGTVIAAVVVSVLFGLGGALLTGIGMHRFAMLVDQAPGLNFRIAISAAAGVAAGSFAAVLVPMNLGVDAVAGERERHTLETLLTVPMTAASILWAKTAAILVVCVIVSLLGALATVAALLVLYAHHAIGWALLALVVAVVAPIVPAFVLAGWAFFFSARAKTVKDGAQKMAILFIPLFLVPELLFLMSDMLPPRLFLTFAWTAAAAGVAFAVLGPLLAFHRFQRPKLIGL